MLVGCFTILISAQNKICFWYTILCNAVYVKILSLTIQITPAKIRQRSSSIIKSFVGCWWRWFRNRFKLLIPQPVVPPICPSFPRSLLLLLLFSKTTYKNNMFSYIGMHKMTTIRTYNFFIDQSDSKFFLVKLYEA